MTSVQKSGTFTLGGRTVNRLGYGAMQLAGPGVFGPPKDHDMALAVLREAIAQGVNHIDTSDFYGPHVTNRIIREALHPYSDDLTIVTKVGARRGADGSWIPAMSPDELMQAVHDNLRNLAIDVLDVVNLRGMFDVHGPAEGSLEAPLTVLAELQRKGLVRHIGLSNVTPTQIAQGRKICAIVCVQNYYNLAHRDDDRLIDDLAGDGTAYVPFFPLGGFNPLQSSTLSAVAARLGATPMQVALAWLLRRAPNILLIPGTSSTVHLKENLAATGIVLSDDVVKQLEGVATIAAWGVQRSSAIHPQRRRSPRDTRLPLRGTARPRIDDVVGIITKRAVADAVTVTRMEKRPPPAAEPLPESSSKGQPQRQERAASQRNADTHDATGPTKAVERRCRPGLGQNSRRDTSRSPRRDCQARPVRQIQLPRPARRMFRRQPAPCRSRPRSDPRTASTASQSSRPRARRRSRASCQIARPPGRREAW